MVLEIVVFIVIMFVLAELPLIGYLVAPEATQVRVTGFQDWMSRNGMTVAMWFAALLGAYLIIKGAAAAIDFYKEVFGAIEVMRMPQPDGRVGHAELKLGDSFVMLADEFPEMNIVGPQTLGNTTVGLLLYVDDVDKVVERAVARGAKIKKPIETQVYGDRNATLEDPYGHKWTVAVHVEDVSPDEMERRMAAAQKK